MFKSATEKSFAGGWFHSGDLAVVHPEGYIELRNRLREIIVVGGDNVSSSEVEQTLAMHPFVADVAVVDGQGRDGHGNARGDMPPRPLPR